MTTCITLFYMFFKIGLFAFGGGYAILPMIYQDIQSFALMSAGEFSDIVALSQMTPGPIAVNAATYIGYNAAGFWGAVFATIGVVLPSFIIVLTVIALMNRFKTSPVVQAVLAGIRPATVGLISAAVVFFIQTSIISEGFFSLRVFENPLNFVSIPGLAVFAATIFCSVRFNMGPILLTVLAGIAGVFIF